MISEIRLRLLLWPDCSLKQKPVREEAKLREPVDWCPVDKLFQNYRFDTWLTPTCRLSNFPEAPVKASKTVQVQADRSLKTSSAESTPFPSESRRILFILSASSNTTL
mmetsp:Transcript_13598/g.16484  ORF Transcript_13598/g.16484 Transcript_13598/m.16484 type:complete len:108 (-) Transcript_13598:139-462(-)